MTVVLMLARVLASRKEAAEVAARSLEAGARRRAFRGCSSWCSRTSAPASSSSGSSSRCCSGRACRGRCSLLVASPVVSLILAFSTGLWGAWFLMLVALVLYYRPYIVEGVVLVARERRDGCRRADPLGASWRRISSGGCSCSSIPSADPRASGYHVLQSQDRDRLGRTGSARDSRSARRSGSHFCRSSTPTSSSPSSARSWGSLASRSR